MRNLLILIIGSILIASCGGGNPSGEKTQASTDLPSSISSAEKKLDMANPDPAKINALLKMYVRYADSLPKDKRSPVYLVRASDLYHAQGQYTLKCQMYEKVMNQYPDFKDLDMVMYLYALSLDSELNMREKAKTGYQQYIEKFPKSQYVPDAQARLSTIDSLSFSELQDRITENALKDAR